VRQALISGPVPPTKTLSLALGLVADRDREWADRTTPSLSQQVAPRDGMFERDNV
jgi:hypothetical protein